MAQTPDIATLLATVSGWTRPGTAPDARPAALVRCPQCGEGRLRFDREIPDGAATRRYDRCTAAGCDFECMRLV